MLVRSQDQLTKTTLWTEHNRRVTSRRRCWHFISREFVILWSGVWIVSGTLRPSGRLFFTLHYFMSALQELQHKSGPLFFGTQNNKWVLKHLAVSWKCLTCVKTLPQSQGFAHPGPRVHTVCVNCLKAEPQAFLTSFLLCFLPFLFHIIPCFVLLRFLFAPDVH